MKRYSSRALPAYFSGNCCLEILFFIILWISFTLTFNYLNNYYYYIIFFFIPQIGLMRNGVLLAEDTPTNIMIKFGTQSIEDAFLILSQRQGNEDQLNEIMSKGPTMPAAAPLPTEVIDAHEPTVEKPPLPYVEPQGENSKKIFFTTKGRLKAMMTKNFVQLFRQPS